MLRWHGKGGKQDIKPLFILKDQNPREATKKKKKKRKHSLALK